MERPERYGSNKYKSCMKCLWTGPIDAFEEISALISSYNLMRCPSCGELLDIENMVFESNRTKLPQGFTIISGGQTGVDRGALDAAIASGIPHRGWCPKGRKAEDGPIPDKYNLYELNDFQYWKRTEKNVLDSDGTLIFPGDCESKGTALTIRLAKKHEKPVAVVSLDSDHAGRTVSAWIKAEKITVMNVAGPRESGCPGISVRTRNFLLNLLNDQK
ncbi:putative molybdenum carrier protein [Maridesulfovibrio zosterae]|uniref:putative molybdenum carrier protein n=1 Tax=Maridesulfovibrio zosterae TaxID=82171 RepID=UPI001B7FCF2C|nr:putative molybdenum carrier protein [Maridesulfovibrio zosterae]